MSLSLIHLYFPKYFNWSENLGSLSLINRQMMMVHTFFIALAVFLVGLLSFSFPQELIDTKLGKKISLGLGIFWTIRLIVQIFIYSSKHWKGKTFETTIHIIFTIFWLYLSFIFLSIGFA